MKKSLLFGLAIWGSIAVAACGSDDENSDEATGGTGATNTGGTAGSIESGGAAGANDAGAPTVGGGGGAAGSTPEGGAAGSAGGAVAGGGGAGGAAASGVMLYAGNLDDGENGLRLVQLGGETAGGAGGAAASLYSITEVDHTQTTSDQQIDAVAFSPDGTRFAVAGRPAASGSFTIYEFNTDGSGEPTLVIESDARGVATMAYSPDGTRIAYITDNGSELFVGTADDSDTSYDEVTDGDYVRDFAWMPDSSALVYVLSSTSGATSGELLISSLDDLENPVSLRADNVGFQVEVAPDDSIYYLYDPAGSDQEARLYTIQPDGSGGTEVDFSTVVDENDGDVDVPADGPLMNQFALSPDGTQVAVSFDAIQADNFQVYVKDLAEDTNARMVSNVDPRVDPDGNSESGPWEQSFIVWSPDGSHLIVNADWPQASAEEDGADSLWIMATSGVPSAQRLLGAPEDELQDAERAAWTPDGKAIFVYGDLEGQNDYAMYLLTDLTTEDQSPSDLRIGPMPATRVVDFDVQR